MGGNPRTDALISQSCCYSRQLFENLAKKKVKPLQKRVNIEGSFCCFKICRHLGDMKKGAEGSGDVGLLEEEHEAVSGHEGKPRFSCCLGL